MNNRKKNKILITGGTGFIGSNLANYLIQQGWDVHLLTRSNSKNEYPIDRNIQRHELSGDIESLIDSLQEIKPSLIIHLAAYFKAEHTHHDIHELMLSNLEFGTKLLDACRISGINKVITTGTSWEDYSDAPLNLYAATKKAFDEISKYYQIAHKLQIIKIKLYDTYGGNDQRKKLLPLLKRHTNTLDPINLSPGGQSIDLLHINDVTRAFEHASLLLLADKLHLFREYLVCSRKSIQLKALVNLICTTTNKKINANWGATSYRNREFMHPSYHGEMLPDWAPEINIEEGLKIYFSESGAH